MAHRIQPIVSCVTVVAASLLLAACGGSDRPAAGDGTSSMAQVSTRSSSDGEGSAAPVDHTPCEPGTFAECKLYYVDESGQPQCPTDVKLCREDGTGYYACGDYVMGEDGPVRRDSTSGEAR